MDEVVSIGIVADDPLHRHHYQAAIRELGLLLHCCRSPQRFQTAADLHVAPAVWLLGIHSEVNWEIALELFLEDRHTPVVLAEDPPLPPGAPGYANWLARLRRKLVGSHRGAPSGASVTAPPKPATATLPPLPGSGSATLARPFNRPTWLRAAQAGQPAPTLIILAASTGGPEAVKSFLDSLPPDLPIAMLYAQHIYSEGLQALLRVLTRHSHYRLGLPRENHRMQSGDLICAPPDTVVEFAEDGRLHIRAQPWQGHYAPSIDQIILNAIQRFPGRCEIVFFSGMGDDGARAVGLAQRKGARIWCQRPESCVNPAMVESILSQVQPAAVATPRELAEKLLKSLESDDLLARRQTGRPCPR